MMTEENWSGAPLESFGPQMEFGENGLSTGRTIFPHGEGAAQSLMEQIAYRVQDSYEHLLSEEDGERYEQFGKVPIIRNGRRVYESIDALTLQDMPAILDTLAVLEEEARTRDAQEAAQLEERRKARRRELERERRKRKKLGEW
jgi:hypothetical protein